MLLLLLLSLHTVIDCESLPDPPNGMVTQSSTTFGAEADYSCDDGYMIVGGATPRVCEGSGNWSGSAPSCQCKWVWHGVWCGVCVVVWCCYTILRNTIVISSFLT